MDVHARHALPVDLKTLRPEPVRGAWVVRDGANILLNFGPNRADAEQAAAVAKRYGFNRVGYVGSPAPSSAYFFTGPTVDAKPAANDAFAALAAASQEASLTRTGVDVPGLGYVGERVAIDPRRAEVRKDRGEWVLASGPDVLARFGYSELTARDALRVVQDGRFTDFCRVGGLTFFLAGGQPPTRVPFAAQGTHFDPAHLQVRELTGAWGVYEANGRRVLLAASKDEAELQLRVVRGYHFDQVCQVGTSPKASLRFLAKTGR